MTEKHLHNIFQDFRLAMKPKIEQIQVNRSQGIAEVQFQVNKVIVIKMDRKYSLQEPKTGVRAALGRIRGVKLMYVAEIVPPAETAVEAFKSMYASTEDEKLEVTKATIVQGLMKRACFHGLKTNIHYTIKISTVVNGKTICQVSEEIEDYHERLPVKIMKLLLWDVEISTTN